MCTRTVIGGLMAAAFLACIAAVRADDDDHKDHWKRQYETQKKELKKWEEARKDQIERWKEAEEERLERAEHEAKRYARGSQRERIDEQYDRWEDELEAAEEREEKAAERLREWHEKQLRLQYEAAREAPSYGYLPPRHPLPQGSHFRLPQGGFSSHGPWLHDPHEFHLGGGLPAVPHYSPGAIYQHQSRVPVNPPVPVPNRFAPELGHSSLIPYYAPSTPPNSGRSAIEF